MKISKIDLRNLRNDEHFQFCTDFIALANSAGAEKLKVKPQMDAFTALFFREREALQKISKSVLTGQIEAADRSRDETFRGMADANRSALRHFTPAVREAAERLQIVFDTYGNVAKKATAEETAAIAGLIGELSGNHADDVETVGLGGWIEELGKRNGSLAALMRDRYDEAASQSALVLRDVRAQADEAYRAVAERINALMVVEGGEAYESFIRRLNAIIERVGGILAQRRGRSAGSGQNGEQGAV